MYYIQLYIFFNRPVQLPLHEPYFDLTLIRAMHTKKFVRTYY